MISRPATPADPMFPASAHFGLGAAFDRVDAVPDAPSPLRPFGLRAAREVPGIEVDFGAVRYDPLTQTAVIDQAGVVVPFAKHTTGTTSTRTSDGKGSMDSDSDQRQD